MGNKKSNPKLQKFREEFLKISKEERLRILEENLKNIKPINSIICLKELDKFKGKDEYHYLTDEEILIENMKNDDKNIESF